KKIQRQTKSRQGKRLIILVELLDPGTRGMNFSRMLGTGESVNSSNRSNFNPGADGVKEPRGELGFRPERGLASNPRTTLRETHAIPITVLLCAYNEHRCGIPAEGYP